MLKWRRCIDEDLNSGYPKTAIILEMSQKIHDITIADRRLNDTCISCECVYHFLTQDLALK